MAGFLLEASADDLVFRDGAFHVVGTDRSICARRRRQGVLSPGRLPKSFGVGLEASGHFAADPPAFPNGCHICEVEIDPDTGEVAVDRYTAVDDFGRLINPLIVGGQVHGALAQGIGQALGEHVVYDGAGQLVTASFMDYAMPRAEWPARVRPRLQRGAVPDQSARREGRRRGRLRCARRLR